MLRAVLCGVILFCLAFAEAKSQDILPALLNTYQTKNPEAIEARLTHVYHQPARKTTKPK
jgi:hypothetical protein